MLGSFSQSVCKESASSDVADIIPALTPRSGVKKNKKGKSPVIAILHVMFIAQQPGEVHGRIAVSTTAGVINYEVKGNATANQYRIDPVVHSKVSGGEVMHHPLSVFNPFNEVMQISQVFTNDTFIQLLAPGEFRQAGHKRTPAGSGSLLPERAGSAWKIQPQEQSIVGYAKFTLPPGKLQLIVNDTDAVSATLDVPYKANVLYGSLGFMNDKTKFLATPGRVTSTMRAIMVSNNFSVPILIRSAKIDDASFKISHFQPDTVLQPGEAASLMHLEYTSNGSSALCTRDLELATNVTVGALLSYSLKAWIFKAT
ncbi:unnamed protein product [Durusdinium trenchii]|uniref:Transmembrane protein 131 n=2 Tax=Durusdinium trenchii TaxID=1381693 RepID=A0ABP0PF50_9DINO